MNNIIKQSLKRNSTVIFKTNSEQILLLKCSGWLDCLFNIVTKIVCVVVKISKGI